MADDSIILRNSSQPWEDERGTASKTGTLVARERSRMKNRNPPETANLLQSLQEKIEFQYQREYADAITCKSNSV